MNRTYKVYATPTVPNSAASYIELGEFKDKKEALNFKNKVYIEYAAKYYIVKIRLDCPLKTTFKTYLDNLDARVEKTLNDSYSEVPRHIALMYARGQTDILNTICNDLDNIIEEGFEE